MQKLLKWPATFKFSKFFSWFDKHLLEIGVSFLLFFIPLYPKLPLVDVSNTWVYVRLEDVLVAAVVGFWLIQLWRRKVTFKPPLVIPIGVYWLVGGISVLFSLIFLRTHLANFFPHLAILHYLRRIEYMILFFVAASTIKDIKRVKRYLLVAAVALGAVCLYGFGQKFLGWPAFLTMNEEFAKGVPLYLPETARITSTFAGHYDLAAYLVLVIALFGSLFFGLKRWALKIPLLVLVFASFILLLFTASRISFMVYLMAISLVLYLQKKKWLIIPVVLISLILMSYVSGASGRFGKTFRVEEVVYDARTGKPIAAVQEEAVQEVEELPLGTGFIQLPLVQKEAPEATEVAMIRKSLKTATMSSEIATISGQFLIQRAIVYDISFTTRFQGTWPRAYKAFQRNPLLGSGYSAIDVGTDSSYLRALGETGLLGFFAFLGLFFSLGLLAKQGLARIKALFGRSMVIGMTAGVLGLMLNAVLIDVFEASKVAFSLWILLGITVGTINFYLPRRKSLVKEAIEVINWPIVPIVFFAFLTFLVFLTGLANYFVGDDFTWLRWAATSRIADIPQFFLSAEGFFYRPLAKTYFLLVKPFFGLNPAGYHLFDFALHFGCVLGAYLLTLRLSKKKLVAFIASLIFLVHPVNSEAVLWISSTSILLARFFLLWGFIAYLQWRQSQKKWKPFLFVAVLLAFIFGLASHELMVVFPLLLLLYDFLFHQFKKSVGWLEKMVPYLPFGFLTVVYFWLRNNVAQAHWLSGDYSYNLRYFALNFVGNLFGYLGELIAGFRFLPVYDLTRVSLRSHKLMAVALLIAGLFLVKLFLSRLKLTKLTLFSIGWLIILLLPFLGLGNIAERYVYLANLGFFILIGLGINWVYQTLKKRHFIFGLVIASLLIGLLAGFYNREFTRVKEDWRQAGELSNQTLLALSSNYAEFPQEAVLYFVNLPLRLSRAWVFPVGLEDGLWFIYRDETLVVKRTDDLDQTLKLTEDKPKTYVFLYEDKELKEIKR